MNSVNRIVATRDGYLKGGSFNTLSF